MRFIVFKGTAFADFNDWYKTDKQIFKNLANLIEETRRSPFTGTGKPEALKHQFRNCWSRRINDQHRLVYRVTNETIEIIACKFHYK